MWCPKCRNEYINGVTTCVDCGCDLVEELPEEIDENEPDCPRLSRQRRNSC